MVPIRAAELFRAGIAGVAKGDLEAMELIEESADLEGGLGGSVTRAQAVRMLVQRRHIDDAIALLERSAKKDPDVRWRTLGDVLEPLVDAGRSDEAVTCLIATAESLRNAHDFTPAFTGFLNVFQTVRVPPQIDEIVLAALRRSSGDRLDARLAVERLSAGRSAAAGRSKEAMIRLAKVAADAVVRGDREVERRAATATISLAAATLTETPEDADGPSDPERLLIEFIVGEEAAQELGSAAHQTAESLEHAALSAALEGERGAAAILDRTAAMLFERAGKRDEALTAVARALEHAEATHDVLVGEVCFVIAWLDGANPEPETSPGHRSANDAAPAFDPDELAGEETERSFQAPDPSSVERGRLLVDTPDRDAWTVRIGGFARLPRGMRWPQCGRCGDPLTFVAELGPDALPGATPRRAMVYACNVAPWVDGYESSCDAAARAPGDGSVVIVSPADEDAPQRLPPTGAPIVTERLLTTVTRRAGHASHLEEIGGPPLATAPSDHVTGAPMLLAARLGGKDQATLHVVNGGFLSIFIPDRLEATRGAAFWWTATGSDKGPADEPPTQPIQHPPLT